MLAQASSPVGRWRSFDDKSGQPKSIIEIVEVNGELQGKVDHWIETTVLYVLEHERHQVAELISGTVARWDPDEASRRIEVQVGRDLQFIRINGTLVGGLAGLGIYTVAQLL